MSLKEQFPSSTREAEAALKEWGIEYTNQGDGTLLVKGDIDISHKSLHKLPDLSCVVVEGNFSCGYNQLTSLKGAPQSVHGGFYCQDNQITSLKGAPQFVGTHFRCETNQLASLEGAPQSIKGDFICHSNNLTSLARAPRTVEGWFSCANNLLISLEDAPQRVDGHFYCHENSLISLEGAPAHFQELHSDFGTFSSPQDIPEDVRYSPETRARMKEEFERATDCSRGIEADMDTPQKIQFKRKPKACLH